MKKYFVYCIVCFAINTYGKTNLNFFKINGSCLGAKDSTLINLSYVVENNGLWIDVADTTYTKDGRFQFSGKIDGLTSALLIIDNNTKDIPIYIEPTIINLSLDKENPYASELSGTGVDAEYADLRNTLNAATKELYVYGDSVNNQFVKMALHENEQTVKDSLMERAYYFKANYMEISKKMENLRQKFIQDHNSYKINPSLLYFLSRDENISIDSVITLYENLPAESKNTPSGNLAWKQIRESERLAKTKDVQVGDIASDFSRKSMQGDTIRLSDFRNKKVVLLDFWASWCVYCIKNIPEVKKLYDQFDKNKLQIIGISYDAKEENWLKSIHDNKIDEWSQIPDRPSFDKGIFSNGGSICDMYNIRGLPAYVLIDEQGKISAIWHHIGDEEINLIAKTLNK